MAITVLLPHWRGLRARRWLWAALMLAAWSPAAQAYIDPNSAGLLYQILFPLFVAVMGAWRWLKSTLLFCFDWFRDLMT